MQGCWQEIVSGWNHKDSKRKKIIRKHLLKDKAKVLIRNGYYKDFDVNIKIEGISKFEISSKELYPENFKESMIAEVCYIRIYVYDIDHPHDGYYKYRIAYFDKRHWIDIYTGEIYLSGAKVSFLYSKEIKLNVPDNRIRVRKIGEAQIFIYNKPIPVDYPHIFGFWSTKCRKYVQKRVNKSNRLKTKAYIIKQDWDKEIKQNDLSKSIAWAVW